MPMLIEHIDAIARKKKRGVLFLCFNPEYQGINDNSWLDYDFKKDVRRKNVLKWFDKHGIAWQMCGQFASETSFCSYLGEIYIDVPYDENDQQYQMVRDYLENPDGTMRDKNVRFYYVPLEAAMKNAHHDEPGFWDKWAEEL